MTDIVNPTPLLPTMDGLVNNETGLPQGPILPDEPRVEIPEDQDMRDREEDAESSHADDHDDQVGRTVGGGTGPEAIVVEPSLKNVLDAMKTMGDQLIALTQTFTPLVNSSVGQANPPARVATRTAGTRVRRTADVVEIEPPVRRAHKVDYLKVLEHISKLGTKHFAGSVDPIEAVEWRSRLVRNFSSTRCPEEYKRDIAVHFLEGDAHNWWLALDKRTNGTIDRFADFEVEFNHKYFPAEAWDRLESKFLDLTQGRKTVREYEEEFNRLRKYVGRELEDEAVQVRRFIRGLRADLKTYCSVRTFHTVTELVERMAILEANIAEEAKQKSRSHTTTTGSGGDRKRKRDSADEGKTSSGKPECSKCGRRHGGECWKAMGACTRCGKMNHSARDCPSPLSSSGSATCHGCGKVGHYRRDCPKNQSGPEQGRGETSRPNQNRNQSSAPRVYELCKDTDEDGQFQSITGNSFCKLDLFKL